MLLTASGGVLGLFLGLALCAKRDKSAGERLLALLFLLSGLDLFLRHYLAVGAYRHFPYLLGIDRSIPLLYAPLLYLLATAAAGHLTRLRPRHLFHLFPVALHLLIMLPFYLKSPATKIFLQEQFIPEVAGIEPYPLLLYAAKTLTLLCYLIAAFHVIGRHERLIREFFSAIDRYELSWLRLLLLVPSVQFLILLSVFLSHLLFLPRFAPIAFPEGYYLAHIIFFALAGIQLIAAPGIWRGTVPIEALFEPAEEDPAPETEDKYRKTRLDPELAERYRNELTAHMERERPFRDPLLTLPQLAKQLGIPPHHLSQVINALCGRNFYTFVNGYRIGYAKELLGQTDGPANILEVAFAAGFNSKSAFNTYFRKETGVTPSEFRRRTLNR